MSKHDEFSIKQNVGIVFDENTSHSSILKQLIDRLVWCKFAKRKEIEAEFIALLQTKTYRETVD